MKLTKRKYRLTIGVLKLLNIILNIEEKLVEKPAILKAPLKTKLVLENAIAYFCAYIKPSTRSHNKNFLNNKLKIFQKELPGT